ncbi:hypothetical protein [Flavobacterium sp. CF136]|uniref:hypothetical protein n=1 Tax=Flavobacterium sp. (strain CF136) TaxID=1144313 RepID=UPI0002717C18|nr:hypothetical protein [Flavobacterium sp. CF136]EJL66915.1 hypothetical protein PMI10_00495 [Flavobacterium sp. CF136]
MSANLLQRFCNTTLSNDKTKILLGKCLKKAFDESISDPVESENILGLAWKFQVPQFDEMFEDHQNHDYPPFSC